VSKSSRRNVTLSINQELLTEARDLDLDLSTVTEAALRTAIQVARRKQWASERTEGGVAVRSGFAAGGPRLAGWQSLQPNSDRP